MPFEPGEGRPPLAFTEGQIRYAIKNTKSNREAARFLRVSVPTYRKYAIMYIDEATGKNLYDLHKNQSGKSIKKRSNGRYRGTPLEEILEGKHPQYGRSVLKKRILHENILPECCSNCGYEERRVSDYTVPLIMNYKDGNKTNHLLENLELLCFNCYYLFIGNPIGRKKDWDGYINQ